MPLNISLNDCLSFFHGKIMIHLFEDLSTWCACTSWAGPVILSRTADVLLFTDLYCFLGSLLCVCGNFVSSHINVHPQWVSGADVCDGIERVDGSIHGGSCCGVHIERNQTLEHSSSTFQFKGSVMRDLVFFSECCMYISGDLAKCSRFGQNIFFMGRRL